MPVVTHNGTAASQLATPLGPFPGRARLLARTRRIAFGVLLGVVALSLGVGWLAVSQLGAVVGHLVALMALSVLAFIVAQESTGVVEALFRQEDRLDLGGA